MAHSKYFEYRDIYQAKAFKTGVEYANDGAINVAGIYTVPGPRGKQHTEATHYVHIIDDDGDKSDGDPLPKRWSQRTLVEDVPNFAGEIARREAEDAKLGGICSYKDEI